MGLEQQLESDLEQLVSELVVDSSIADSQGSAGGLDPAKIAAAIRVSPPKRGVDADCSTGAALALSKPLGMKPRELAERIADALRAKPSISQVEVAGPGFINVKFSNPAFHGLLREILRQRAGYGKQPAATGERINLEFVSANPTGPLLVSHGRGAVIGDAVARLLEATGHRVTREYYINDFGNQVVLLGRSVLNAARAEAPPEGGYGGGYVKEMADWLSEHRPDLVKRAGQVAEDAPIESDQDPRRMLTRECIRLMLDGVPGAQDKGIKATLVELGVEFDVWSSEDGLHRWGRVERTLDQLASDGRLATGDDGAVSFATGDDDEKDRVVKKRDGNFTYFASDIAYHDDKIQRGFQRLIDVWGADHHGYVARVRSALAALGHSPERFEVLLFQLVKLLRDGKPYKMGKRLGNLITIGEVVEEIDAAVGHVGAGSDALRYFYLARRVDTPIELDIELAKRQKSENPVFYIQYGYARLCSIQRRAAGKFGLTTPRLSEAALGKVEHRLELEMLGLLGRFPSVVDEAAAAREPQKLVTYLREIAHRFQSYYTQLRSEGDAILPLARDMTEGWEQRWDKQKTMGRLLWIEAIRTVYQSGLELLGITAPEHMRSPEEDAATS